MIGFFLIGGAAGVVSAGIALLAGATWQTGLTMYFCVGFLLPISGIVSQIYRGDPEDMGLSDDLSPTTGTSDSLKQTLAQWDADPESGTAEAEETRNNRVA